MALAPSYSANKYKSKNSPHAGANQMSLAQNLSKSFQQENNEAKFKLSSREQHQENKKNSSGKLNELIDTLDCMKLNLTSNEEKSEQDECEEESNASISNYTSVTNLKPAGSTEEFRNYLDELKRSYLSKVTLSCPSKMSNVNGASRKPSASETFKAANAAAASLRRALVFDDAMNASFAKQKETGQPTLSKHNSSQESSASNAQKKEAQAVTELNF
jgi:hypothetical protein